MTTELSETSDVPGLAARSESDLDEPADATVLVVDDQRVIRRAFCKRLEKRDYTVREAETGRGALEEVDRHRIDLVVLDIGLPDIDGFEVLETLRAEFELSQLPVVMLTGKDSEQDVVRALELGANDYVTKDTNFKIARARFQTQLKLRHARNRLDELVRTDALTGVMNRRAFFERVEHEHERFKRTGSPYAVLMIDIDRFKDLNDTYGHPEGDRVLQTFARRIEQETRSVDLVARLGGEEFVVLLSDMGYEQARSAAERLRECVAETSFSVGQTEVQVTVSIGFAAQSTDPRLPPEKLVDLADAAMYDAKGDGRDCVRGRRA